MLQRFGGPEGKGFMVEALEIQPLIGGEPGLASALAETATLQGWAAGDSIIQDAGAGNELHFILAGTVSIIVNGREVAVRVSGEEVGEMALLNPGRPRSATVVAKEETVTASVPAGVIRELADSRPALWRNVARVLADRLRQRNRFVPSRNAVPELFIGCSSEALPVAEAIGAKLGGAGIAVRLWNRGVFRASFFTLESLEEALSTADFAALVLSPDDWVTSRDETMSVPRDNVVFELGLFMGALGHARTFLVRPSDEAVKIPTDLAGLTALTYSLVPGENVPPEVAGICEEIASIVGELDTR